MTNARNFGVGSIASNKSVRAALPGNNLGPNSHAARPDARGHFPTRGENRSKRSANLVETMPFFCDSFPMKATIDTAGRIVVPKALRQALGLKPGQPLEIRAGDGRLEIEIASTPMRLQKQGKGVVAVPDVELPTLTADQVRETMERVRR